MPLEMAHDQKYFLYFATAELTLLAILIVTNPIISNPLIELIVGQGFDSTFILLICWNKV